MNTETMKIAWASITAPSQAAVLRLNDTEYGSQDHAKLIRVRQLLLDEADKDGPSCLIVDLSAVRHFGAGFAGVLVATSNRLKERNRRLALCGLNPVCAELIQIMRLNRVFDIYPTLAIALEEIEGQDQRALDEPGIIFQGLLACVALRSERTYNCRRVHCSQVC
jgi:anti-anti-sigma factor